MDKEDGGPAFPAGNYGPHQQGMSLRDWFAGQALSGEIRAYNENPAQLAKRSYAMDDAMLEARK